MRNRSLFHSVLSCTGAKEKPTGPGAKGGADCTANLESGRLSLFALAASGHQMQGRCWAQPPAPSQTRLFKGLSLAVSLSLLWAVDSQGEQVNPLSP